MPPFPRTPPPLPRPVLFDQEWADLTFLHWAVDPDAVAPWFPAGTRPDRWTDGTTYVGLVPFRMQGAGPGPRLRVPWFGSFAETNIRLSSVDEQGRHGVVFRSLDAERLAVVLLARLGLGLPYRWSRMRTTRVGPVQSYGSVRHRRSDRTSCELVVRIGDPVQPTPLEEFLTARWGLHTSIRGRTAWIPNEHPPWTFRAAEILHLQDGLAASAGVTTSGPPDLRPLWSPGVRTRFGRPTLL